MFGRLKVQRKIIFVLVSIVIIVLGVGFPIYHFYASSQNKQEAISVSNGSASVVYSGDFQNNSSGNSFILPTEEATAMVFEADHQNSSLTIGIHKGQIYYDKDNKHIVIDYNFTVSGRFSTNLQPSSLTLSFNASGLSNQSGVALSTFAPPFSTVVPSAENMSVNMLGNLWLSGLGQKNVTTRLLSENPDARLYNFSVSVEMETELNWYSNSTHTFLLGVSVNGLQKPVFASISMTIEEVNK